MLGDIIDIARHKNVAMSWGSENMDSYLSDDDVKTGAFVRIAESSDQSFSEKYPNAIALEAHTSSEKAYIIPSMTESEFKKLSCIKKIRCENNFKPSIG